MGGEGGGEEGKVEEGGGGYLSVKMGAPPGKFICCIALHWNGKKNSEKRWALLQHFHLIAQLFHHQTEI